MDINKKQIIVVGDRILIKPIDLSLKTKSGLYLPETVKSKEEVSAGIVVDQGPGIPMADPSSAANEPWKDGTSIVRYIPMQAAKGDLALFLKKAAIEVRIDNETYLIIPQAALLVLLRDDENEYDGNVPEDRYLA